MKPKYIRKYDYLQSFSRPKNQWFFPTEIIEELIRLKTKDELTKNDVYFDDEEDEDVYKETENDSLELVKQMDFDEIKQKKRTDPKIYEGNLLDESSRKYITEYYSKVCPNIKVVDLSTIKGSNEKIAEETLNLIKNNDNFLLFQSAFIEQKHHAIAKPDALVKIDDKITIIETKGTSSTKFHHLMDIYYQKNVINEVLLNEIDRSINEYKLCIIKYCLQKAKEPAKFVLVDTCFVASDVVGSFQKKHIQTLETLEEKVEYKSNLKENLYIDGANVDCDSYIKDLLLNNANLPKRTQPSFNEKYEKYLNNEENFWNRIDKLYEHLKTFDENDLSKINLSPSIEYKTSFKNVEYWLLLRDYYYLSKDIKMFPMKFSGNLIHFKPAIEAYKNEIFSSEQEIISKLKTLDVCKQFNTYEMCCYQKQRPIWLKGDENCSYTDDTINLLNKLKTKKVYFDFESLNLATRVIDDYPPFMQTVNQVSVTIDHGEGLKHPETLEDVDAIVIDPINGITKEDFKIIIDAILPSKDLNECQQYSYIVFNKNFEKTRLNEMDLYLDDAEYSKKIKVIVNNLYDIADLFIIKSLDSGKSGKPIFNFVVFKELFGFYSIKKVLPLIKKHRPDIFKSTGCVDYKLDLQDIHNGTDAQRVSTMRFFGLMDDEQWKIAKQNLKKYCNNDVRAMVAVEHFLRQILV